MNYEFLHKKKTISLSINTLLNYSNLWAIELTSVKVLRCTRHKTSLQRRFPS